MLALAVLVGCETIGREDRTRLTLYQQNAAQYYDERHFEQAYQQWQKALDADPMNDKARLGQAMTLYQLGREESPEGVARLSAAEERLDELRREDLDGQEWKAELGYALVQDRWVELLDRKVRLLEDQRTRHGTTDETELATARSELATRIAAAERSYAGVLKGGEKEAQYQLTSLMGQAKMASYRGDYDATLKHSREYEEHIVTSKRLWRDAIERFPKDAPLYERKLRGAERQEAELRDLVGNVLFKLGRFEEALGELDTVIALDPSRASAFLNRGLVREKLQDWDRSRQDLRTFIAMTTLGPGDPTVRQATERLAAVQTELDLENQRLARPDGR